MSTSPEVVGKLLAALSADSTPVGTHRLCKACVEVLPVDRAAISVMPRPASRSAGQRNQGETEHHEVVCASDAVAARIEELQVTLGEGPTVEAFKEHWPVSVPDLHAHQVRDRWPVFAGVLGPEDAGAMFCFPLQLGVIRLGILDLYRNTPGSLDPPDLAGVLQVVDAVTRVLLASAPGNATTVFADLEPIPISPQIHQAVGMLIAQLNVNAEEAYARLRAYAFANEQPLKDVADNIVMRRLRLDPQVGGQFS